MLQNRDNTERALVAGSCERALQQLQIALAKVVHCGLIGGANHQNLPVGEDVGECYRNRFAQAVATSSRSHRACRQLRYGATELRSSSPLPRTAGPSSQAKGPSTVGRERVGCRATGTCRTRTTSGTSRMSLGGLSRTSWEATTRWSGTTKGTPGRCASCRMWAGFENIERRLSQLPQRCEPVDVPGYKWTDVAGRVRDTERTGAFRLAQERSSPHSG